MGFIDPSTLPEAEPKPGWHGGTLHAVAVKERCRATVVDYPVRHEVAGIKI